MQIRTPVCTRACVCSLCACCWRGCATAKTSCSQPERGRPTEEGRRYDATTTTTAAADPARCPCCCSGLAPGSATLGKRKSASASFAFLFTAIQKSKENLTTMDHTQTGSRVRGLPRRFKARARVVDKQGVVAPTMGSAACERFPSTYLPACLPARPSWLQAFHPIRSRTWRERDSVLLLLFFFCFLTKASCPYRVLLPLSCRLRDLTVRRSDI